MGVVSSNLRCGKGGEWLKIMKRSLAILGRKPGRILASISVGEALRYEQETLQRAPINMICKKSTRYVRALVTELAANDPAAPTINQFGARLPAEFCHRRLGVKNQPFRKAVGEVMASGQGFVFWLDALAICIVGCLHWLN